MRNLSIALGALFLFSLAGFARADSCCGVAVADATVTLEGKLQCAKCALHEGDKCQDVLVVKDGDKSVRYDVVLTGDAKGKHVCSGEKDVKVTGTVAEKDGKKILTATKIEESKA